MLKEYLKGIYEIQQRGDAREESYYSTLEELLERYSEEKKLKEVQVTTLPKKTEAGNPDFRVWDGKTRITGYIEAKDPSKEDLDSIEETDQLQRYLHTFPNLILTNFYEFRLYRDGKRIALARVARPFISRKLKTLPPVEEEKEFYALLDKFFSFSIPKTVSAEALAVELAKRTRFLKDEVMLEEVTSGRKGSIYEFYEAFKKYLIHDLSEEDFADLYSQTIAYGLFAARSRCKERFSRRAAYDFIPHTIGILREVFKFISLGDLPKQMEWVVDDIVEVLANADVGKILHDYSKEGKGKDPIVHFYETFLKEYDPKTREKRGVYYTPEPVVSYIVRSLDKILEDKFDKEDGLATRAVTVLDPAGGTLTFPAEAAKLAVERCVKKYGEGAREKLIRQHVLENFYAFELMMAPYAVGHMKMGFLFEELGFRLGDEERFKSYLTNTLEFEEFEQSNFPFMKALSEESHEAGKVKRETPILVIMGNPPYSGHSANVGEWISKRIGAYKQVDGKPLGEKNPKWLQDDYVKFIRFAQWKIDEAGRGMVGFITNHSWLDNPTFRGMRRSLMTSFDEVYVLDLHGNSLKKEKCPDGSKDENVFDIQQGVAISIFVKTGKSKEKGVYHSELYGLREKKYSWLEGHDLYDTKWKKLNPKSDAYFFIPRNEKALKEYETFWKVTDVFPVNSVGIVTARDNLTIKFTKDEVWQTVLNFSRLDADFARKAYELGDDARDWKVDLAQKDLMASGMRKEMIVPILYRPFDVRYTYYTGNSRGFHCMPRKDVMRHMMRENLGLITVRQVAEGIFDHAFCVDSIVESRITLSNKGIGYLFPLYLYEEVEPQKKKSTFGGSMMMLFEEKSEYTSKRPNISPKLIEALTKAYKKAPTPEEIFYYIYAVLYSNTYRAKYAEFLKSDFPRVPFTGDYKLFKKVGVFGQELAELHLLKSKSLNKPLVKFQGKGNHKVEKPKYDPKDKKVHINEGQYFEGISSEVWDYHIGGYRVMEKWLKERAKAERPLSLDDIKHYCRMSVSIEETIELQGKIDKVYSEIEENVIEA
ncbi:MAG: N-6 DNA methylase [Deltaproteobacteria bacterium]|nr:N-6 DNA methylase [Deltaproteobacteria bacterium]